MQKDFNYAVNSRRFLLGQIVDSSMQQVDGQYAAEEVIPFGAPVALGTNKERQVKLVNTIITPTSNSFVGIAVRQNIQAHGGQEPVDNTGDQQVIMTTTEDGYPIGAPVTIARYGRIAIKADIVTDNIIGTSRAIYVFATRRVTIRNLGATDNQEVDLGFILTPAVAGELCAIQINKNLK